MFPRHPGISKNNSERDTFQSQLTKTFKKIQKDTFKVPIGDTFVSRWQKLSKKCRAWIPFSPNSHHWRQNFVLLQIIANKVKNRR